MFLVLRNLLPIVSTLYVCIVASITDEYRTYN